MEAVAKELIDELDQLQASHNDGRGIRVVQWIVEHLRGDRYELAQNTRQVDGDKTRSYPDVEAKLYEIFGCRLHGKHGCEEWLCKKD